MDRKGVNRKLYIGIDPGTHTGVAVWDKTSRRLEVVFIEDARKRTWFGNAGRAKLQGAGSIKRDCAIWETFCEELGIECRKIAPKHNTTKLTASQFKVLTNWQGRTSDHARDAAMLVFGR